SLPIAHKRNYTTTSPPCVSFHAGNTLFSPTFFRIHVPGHRAEHAQIIPAHSDAQADRRAAGLLLSPSPVGSSSAVPAPFSRTFSPPLPVFPGAEDRRSFSVSLPVRCRRRRPRCRQSDSQRIPWTARIL